MTDTRTLVAKTRALADKELVSDATKSLAVAIEQLNGPRSYLKEAGYLDTTITMDGKDITTAEVLDKLEDQLAEKLKLALIS